MAVAHFVEPLESRRLTSASVHGLSATYFDSFDLADPVATRIDRTVQFQFGRKPPVKALTSDVFSVQWTGELTPPVSGAYTLIVKADSGVQLTIDGSMIIDTWSSDSPAVSKLPLTFVAGQSYDIQLDYHHDIHASHIALLWTRKGQSAAAIPAIRLSPIVADPVEPTTPPPTITPVTPVIPVLPITQPPLPITELTVDPINGPFHTISAAAAVAQPGDTVLITPGTYDEEVYLTTSGTASAPITFEAQTPGTVIINAANFTQAISSNFGTTSYINLEGITVQGCDNPDNSQQAAVTTGSGWNLTDVTVTGAAGTGIDVYGNGVTLLRVAANDCGLAGLSGGGCSNVLVQDCTTVGNNTLGNDPDYDGGAGKWTQTDHVTIDGLVSHDNTGPGLWFDTDNTNVLIENNTIYNNHGLQYDYSGSGIRCELDLGPVLIQNNIFYGNTGPSVQIESCRNFTVENNSFTGGSLTLEDWPRGDAYTLQNITIEYNTFNDTVIATEAPNWDDTSAATKNITMDFDTYTNTPGNYIVQWGDQLFYTLSDVQSTLGVELHGTRTFQRSPPDASSVAPVNHAESCDAKNTAIGAISSGLPIRPSGVPAISCLAIWLPASPIP